MRIADILEQVTHDGFHGDLNADVSAVVQLGNGDLSADQLAWCSDKNSALLIPVTQGTIICSPETYQLQKTTSCNYILSKTPRLTFKEVVQKFFAAPSKPAGISASAIISEDSSIHPSCYIGHNVIVEKGVEIGEGCIINHNTVLLENCKIGAGVTIGCNCTIGGVGFGYEKNASGNYEVIPHLGNVVIEDDVEIGNNTAIDRAVLGSTVIRRNVKIDNLVHIAHGVVVGENSLVIANSMVAGSVKIGENAWISPSSSIINKSEIGNGALIGMGAVVIRNVPDGVVVAGNPAKQLEKK